MEALLRWATDRMRQSAAELANDRSEGRIDVPQEELERLFLATQEIEDYGVNYNTYGKDALAWDRWERFCEGLNTEPKRRAEWFHTHPEREHQLLAMFVLWLYPKIKPRSKQQARRQTV